MTWKLRLALCLWLLTLLAFAGTLLLAVAPVEFLDAAEAHTASRPVLGLASAYEGKLLLGHEDPGDFLICWHDLRLCTWASEL